jgi:hypothetical protein
MKAHKRILPYVFGLCFIITITILASISLCFKSEIINAGLFIATVALAIIAYSQLNALREQANADFLLKFNRDFFDNETNKKIIPAIEENENLLEKTGGEFTEYQIDDYLGYYELMSWYEKKGIIDFELIDETFGHYISLAWQNKEIKEYIQELRKETKDPRYYKPFEDLANRVIEKEKGVRNAAK